MENIKSFEEYYKLKNKVEEGLDMRFKLLDKVRKNHTDTEILDEIIRGMSDEDVKLYLRDII